MRGNGRRQFLDATRRNVDVVCTLNQQVVPYGIQGRRVSDLPTASPEGFNWTVHLDATKMKTGSALTRGMAIFEIRLAIDRALNDLTNSRG
jgi:hypothetical protein